MIRKIEERPPCDLESLENLASRIEALEQGSDSTMPGIGVRIREAYNLIKYLDRECWKMNAVVGLHPLGKCHCCGEGECQFCLMIQAQEEVAELKEKLCVAEMTVNTWND